MKLRPASIIGTRPSAILFEECAGDNASFRNNFIAQRVLPLPKRRWIRSNDTLARRSGAIPSAQIARGKIARLFREMIAARLSCLLCGRTRRFKHIVTVQICDNFRERKYQNIYVSREHIAISIFHSVRSNERISAFYFNLAPQILRLRLRGLFIYYSSDVYVIFFSCSRREHIEYCKLC